VVVTDINKTSPPTKSFKEGRAAQPPVEKNDGMIKSRVGLVSTVVRNIRTPPPTATSRGTGGAASCREGRMQMSPPRGALVVLPKSMSLLL